MSTSNTSTLSRMQRANLLKAELSTLFKQVLPEGREPDSIDMSYVASTIASEFPEGVPSGVQCGLNAARGMMSPSKLDAIRWFQRALSAALASAGGLALMWGIVTIIAHGVVLTTVTGILWWKVTTVSMLFGGPVGIVAGITVLAAGLYYFASTKPLRARAITAFEAIEAGIDAWATAG